MMSIHYKRKTPLAPEELGPRAVVGKWSNTKDRLDSDPFLSNCSKRKQTPLVIIDDDDDDDEDVIIDDDDDKLNSHEPEKPYLEYRSNYSSMIIEAISTMDKPNGSNFNDILQFIEQRHQVPQNFKSLLSDMLSGLVPQRKLDKVRSCFKIKADTVETSFPRLLERKDNWKGSTQASGSVASAARASTATCCTAKPEDMESFAAEAVKEYETITQIFKDTGSTLDVLKYIHENCRIIQALDS